MVYHVQYPVGQGGFHLGIIGESAYVYDCGSCKNNCCWDKIINSAVSELTTQNIKQLYVFISHLHKDHYNHLSDFITKVPKNVQTIHLYMPPLENIEQLMLICEHKIEKGDIDDRVYANLIIYQKFTDIDESDRIIYHYNDSDIIIGNDIILLSMSTNVSNEDKIKFKENLKSKNIDFDKIENITPAKMKEICDVFKMTFKKKKIAHQIMLVLYCGLSSYTTHYCRYCFCNHGINWFHTGDALMTSNRKQFKKIFAKFKNVLRNVNFAQIPHHASKGNSDYIFFNLFNCNCDFYYTTQENKNGFKQVVVPDKKLLASVSHGVYAVSDADSSKICTPNRLAHRTRCPF